MAAVVGTSSCYRIRPRASFYLVLSIIHEKFSMNTRFSFPAPIIAFIVHVQFLTADNHSAWPNFRTGTVALFTKGVVR